MATVTLPTLTDGTEDYSFRVQLGARTYRLQLQWNARASSWRLYIFDAEDTLLFSQTIVLEWPLLIRSVDPRLPSGEIIAIDTSGSGQEAGLKDLGGRVKLVFIANDGGA